MDSASERPGESAAAARRAASARYKTLDKDDARRNREETTISIRKDKRAENVQKKRFGGMPQMPQADQFGNLGLQAWQGANPESLVAGIHSDDPNLQLQACAHQSPLPSLPGSRSRAAARLCTASGCSRGCWRQRQCALR